MLEGSLEAERKAIDMEQKRDDSTQDTASRGVLFEYAKLERIQFYAMLRCQSTRDRQGSERSNEPRRHELTNSSSGPRRNRRKRGIWYASREIMMRIIVELRQLSCNVEAVVMLKQ